MTLDDDLDAAPVEALLAFCTRCGRELNLQGECGNLYCQQAAAAEPAHAGLLSEERHQASLRTSPLLQRFVAPDAVRVHESTTPPLRARVAKPLPHRKLWRGVSGGQSVLVLQVMGQIHEQQREWGLVPSVGVPSDVDGPGDSE